MNIRFLALVATVTLLSIASGCSGMRNYLFGRGARCGLCRRGGPSTAPAYAPQAPAYAPHAPCHAAPHNPAPCNAAPYSAAPCAPAAPTCAQPMVTAPGGGCGCNGYAYGGNESYGSAYSAGCECGNHGGIVSDPYLSSGSMSPYGGTVMPYEGAVVGEQIVGEQIIGEQIIGEQIIGGTNYPGTVYPGTVYPGTVSPIQPDDFERSQSRKFDTDGNKILWEEPLPSGVIAQ